MSLCFGSNSTTLAQLPSFDLNTIHFLKFIVTKNTVIFCMKMWTLMLVLILQGFEFGHYANVLSFRADSASPLAWDINRWFPCASSSLLVYLSFCHAIGHIALKV